MSSERVVKYQTYAATATVRITTGAVTHRHRRPTTSTLRTAAARRRGLGVGVGVEHLRRGLSPADILDGAFDHGELCSQVASQR